MHSAACLARSRGTWSLGLSYQQRCFQTTSSNAQTIFHPKVFPIMASSSNMAANPDGQHASMSQTGAEVFRRAICYVLTEWPSLNFAIENGMGGQECNQKRAWMCDHIAEVMIKGKDIDLEDYLGEILNQEFDTIVEDGSLEYNVKWIEKFHKDCLQGKEQSVMDSINQAASRKQSLGSVRIPAPTDMTKESSDDDDGEDDDDDE